MANIYSMAAPGWASNSNGTADLSKCAPMYIGCDTKGLAKMSATPPDESKKHLAEIKYMLDNTFNKQEHSRCSIGREGSVKTNKPPSNQSKNDMAELKNILNDMFNKQVGVEAGSRSPGPADFHPGSALRPFCPPPGLAEPPRAPPGAFFPNLPPPTASSVPLPMFAEKEEPEAPCEEEQSSTNDGEDGLESLDGDGSSNGGIPVGMPSTEAKTTLMIRNVPIMYKQEMLMQEWPNNGTYDLLYLPRNCSGQSNLSYAFINFVSEAYAEAFKAKWQKKRLANFTARKPLNISYADVQGLEANLRQLKKKRVRRIQMRQCQPIILKDSKQVTLQDAFAAFGFSDEEEEADDNVTGDAAVAAPAPAFMPPTKPRVEQHDWTAALAGAPGLYAKRQYTDVPRIPVAPIPRPPGLFFVHRV